VRLQTRDRADVLTLKALLPAGKHVSTGSGPKTSQNELRPVAVRLHTEVGVWRIRLITAAIALACTMAPRVAAAQKTIVRPRVTETTTAVIEKIDFKGVDNPSDLDEVKPGDYIDITYTHALLVSVTRTK